MTRYTYRRNGVVIAELPLDSQQAVAAEMRRLGADEAYPSNMPEAYLTPEADPRQLRLVFSREDKV